MVVWDVSIRVGVLYILWIRRVVVLVGREFVCQHLYGWRSDVFLDEGIKLFVNGVGWVDNILVCL